jgi:hypothetical protein
VRKLLSSIVLLLTTSAASLLPAAPKSAATPSAQASAKAPEPERPLVAHARSHTEAQRQVASAQAGLRVIEPQLTALLDKRRQLSAAAAALSAEVQRHYAQGNKAYDQHRQALAAASKRGTAVPTASLEAAQREYAAAAQKAAALKKQRLELAKLTADVRQIAVAAEKAELEAKAAGSNARAADAKLAEGIRVIRQAGAAATRDNDSALQKTGYARTGSFDAEQKRAEQEAAALAAEVAKAKQGLSDVQAAQKQERAAGKGKKGS